MNKLIILILTLFVVSHSLASQTQSDMIVNTLEAPSEGKEYILLRGAKIHTMGSLGTIENADLLIVDNIVQEIGTSLAIPEGASVVDVSSKEITPGLINVSTAMGLVEIGAVKSTVDSRNTNEAYSASLSIADVINANSSLWSHNRSNGLTNVIVKPSNSNSLFQGQGTVIQLTNNQDHILLKDSVAYMTYGDAGAELANGTRALALQHIRQVFADLKSLSESDEPDKYKPKGKLNIRELNALLPVLIDSRPIVVSAHRVNDILAMLELANQYSLTMIISGAEEAWKIKEQVAAAKVALIVNPYNNLPTRFETIGNRIDQMTLLHEAGVPMMISNNASHNAYVIRQIAGNAVAYGLPHSEALAAITKVPAQWFGLDSQIGTLESGMVANLVVWDGDPLEITSSAEQVFIQGKTMPMKSRQTQLRDRYLQKDDRRSAYR